ncbi:hypothetical protein AWRI1631_120890, partial [Saccharomyces cerevisiae AWRI1631]
TESGGTGFSNDNITFLQEVTQLVPHPFLLQWGRSWDSSVSWSSSWDSNWLVTLSGVSNSGQQLLQNEFHLDTWESGVSDLHVVGVEFDNVLGLVRVRERTGVEIRQQSTDRQNQVSRFNGFLNFWLGQGTDVNTTVSWVLFVNGTLTHWGDESWELSQVNQLLSFSLDVVSGTTSISQDNWVLSILDQSQDGVNDFLFGFSIVWLQRHVNWSLQQLSWDVQVDQVSWQT